MLRMPGVLALMLLACGGPSGAANRNPDWRPPPSGTGDWVAWTTTPGWLHVGTRAEWARAQPTSEEIWGGTSTAPLGKSTVSLGPWATRDDALADVCARLTGVRWEYAPTATPRDTLSGELAGRRYHLHLDRGLTPEDVVFVGQTYDVNAELAILLAHGISPRMSFATPQWLVHATGMGTYDGPRQLDQWMLITVEPQDGRFTVPDGQGGTFGYSSDAAEGPFEDSFALAAAMRRHGIASLAEWATGRVISVSHLLDPPVDHGAATR